MSYRKHLKFSLAEMFVLLAAVSVMVALNCVERTGGDVIYQSRTAIASLKYQYYGFPFQMVQMNYPFVESETDFLFQGAIANVLALLFVLVVTLTVLRYGKRLTGGKREPRK